MRSRTTPKLNVLVVFCNYNYPLRPTIVEHTYAIRSYSPHRIYYYNAFYGKLPEVLLGFQPDLIVFQTSFLGQRWSPPLFKQLVDRIRPLQRLKVPKIAVPQDEFINAKYLCEFLNEFDVHYIYPLSSPQDWPNIYCDLDLSKVKIKRVLAGYLDERAMRRLRGLIGRVEDRPIDVGYRAWNAAAWIGRHGQLKVRIAAEFQQSAPRHGLKADISLRDEDVFVGREWYRFLVRCKYAIGAPGGASVLDRDGSTRDRVDAYLKEHPNASFDEISEACLGEADGTLHLNVITPRHLECAFTRTAQVLVRSEYNGILLAEDHYIAVESDFSNVEEVLDTIKRDDRRAEITERAYRDIVASGKYTYRVFAETILCDALQDLGNAKPYHSLFVAWYYSILFGYYELRARLWVMRFAFQYASNYAAKRERLARYRRRFEAALQAIRILVRTFRRAFSA